MFAILSDIHANYEALSAVVSDIARRNIETIYCLGDVVGCGPDPQACVQLAMEFDICLAGNWDIAITTPAADDENESSQMREMIAWTVRQLSPQQLKFLKSRKSIHQNSQMTFAHGGPLDYVNQYLFPEHVYDDQTMQQVFEAFDHTFFCGHTHIAGIHERERYFEPSQVGDLYILGRNQAIINVGSVGRPQDDDHRASYVIVDDCSVRFMRIDYDQDRTKRKMDDLGFGE